MYNKTTRMFRFLNQNCSEFKYPTSLKILYYYSLICSLVEYLKCNHVSS